MLTGDIGVVCVHHSTELGLETSESEIHPTHDIPCDNTHSTFYYAALSTYTSEYDVTRKWRCQLFGFALRSKYQSIFFLAVFSPSMGRLRRARVHNARRDVHRASRTRVSVLTCTFKPFLMNNI